ncbi:hypothetical protein PAPYR_464 [Paratrimastix pyriformis]|uniref:Uncharacterized protein n=1 Tax=Paratrimastix pyriformis TaxID=342808 RepID=A0ABQ8UXL2_9EUKA|nr:hypothetical protein PAPYR_464 [Paratrimastix pyriformis]
MIMRNFRNFHSPGSGGALMDGYFYFPSSRKMMGSPLGFTEEFQESYYTKLNSIKCKGKQGLGFGSSAWEGTGEVRPMGSAEPPSEEKNEEPQPIAPGASVQTLRKSFLSMFRKAGSADGSGAPAEPGSRSATASPAAGRPPVNPIVSKFHTRFDEETDSKPKPHAEAVTTAAAAPSPVPAAEKKKHKKHRQDDKPAEESPVLPSPTEGSAVLPSPEGDSPPADESKMKPKKKKHHTTASSSPATAEGESAQPSAVDEPAAAAAAPKKHHRKHARDESLATPAAPEAAPEAVPLPEAPGAEPQPEKKHRHHKKSRPAGEAESQQ